MKSFSTSTGLRGVHVAAITPRTLSGDLDFGATFELLDYLGSARVTGIALFTSWGEYPALALDERERLLYLAVKRSRVPVLAGVGSATFDQSLALAREARAAGAAAILLPPPDFYPYGRDDIREFYVQFAGQFGHDVPVLIAGTVDTETAGALLESGLFAGIEDSAATIPSLDYLRSRGSAAVLSGNDRLLVKARSAGFGVLSSAACAAPELVMALDQAIAEADTARVARLEAVYRELVDWLERFPASIGVKAAVSIRRIAVGPLAVPLTPAKQESLEEFRQWYLNRLPATTKMAVHA